MSRTKLVIDWLWTFVGLHFLEDFVGLVSRPKTITASFWGMYALASNMVLGVGAVIAYVGLKYLDHEDRAEVSGNHALNIGFTFIAYGATMIFLRTARWLILLRSIGINVITMLWIMEDVVSVFIVFLVIYLSFGMGIWFMYEPFTVGGDGKAGENCTTTYCFTDQVIRDNPGMKGILSQMFWRVFDGDATEARIQTLEDTLNDTALFPL